MSYWLDNAANPGTHVLLDLGYVEDQATRDRADKLFKHIGKRNFQLVAYDRLLVRIPPTKVADILKRFPQIQPVTKRPGYCWCSHTWLRKKKR